jgi:hypothetical protein
MTDPVNHPLHYQGKVECIEAIEASMSPEAFKGSLKANVIKYIWRYEHKNGLEDLRKAQWYLERLIGMREKEEALAKRIMEQSKEVMEYIAHHDPDDYMISGCPDGFCPMPSVRTGPSEPLFKPVHDA